MAVFVPRNCQRAQVGKAKKVGVLALVDCLAGLCHAGVVGKFCPLSRVGFYRSKRNDNT